MEKIMVNKRYKLLYAVLLLSILLMYLLIYYLVKNDTEELLYKAITWGVPGLLIYLTFIARMNIKITEGKQLICKPSNYLLNKTINISQISDLEFKKGAIFSKVVVHYNQNDKIVLYPDNCTYFIESIKKHKN